MMPNPVGKGSGNHNKSKREVVAALDAGTTYYVLHVVENDEFGNAKCINDPEENQITVSCIAFSADDPDWILFGANAFEKIGETEDWIVINGFKRMFGRKYVLFHDYVFPLIMSKPL